VRLVDERTEVWSRSRSPSPVPTARSTEPLTDVPTEVNDSSDTVINTARSVATVPSDDDGAVSDEVATRSETSIVASDSEMSYSSPRHHRHRHSSRAGRRSSEPVSSARSRGSRSSRRSSHKVSEASYSDDFTSAVSVDETSQTEQEDDASRHSVTKTDVTAEPLARSPTLHKHHRYLLVFYLNITGI